MRYLHGLLCLAFSMVVFAAASGGLKWDTVTTYSDGSPIEATQKLVYLVYDQSGKQVASTFATTVTSAQLPADGCYFVRAALFAQETNNVIPGSQSDPTPTYCIKPPQKRVATPTGFGPA